MCRKKVLRTSPAYVGGINNNNNTYNNSNYIMTHCKCKNFMLFFKKNKIKYEKQIRYYGLGVGGWWEVGEYNAPPNCILRIVTQAICIVTVLFLFIYKVKYPTKQPQEMCNIYFCIQVLALELTLMNLMFLLFLLLLLFFNLRIRKTGLKV